MGVLDKFLSVMKLNEDDGFDDDDFLDDEIDDDYEDTKPKKRFFKKLEDEDDFDDYGYDESIKPKTAKTAQKQPTPSLKPRTVSQPKQATSNKIAPMRTKKSSNGMEVCVVKPHSMEDAREITETLLANCTVFLNMEGMDLDLAQRIIDFSSGSCYAMGGNLQKISNYIFIITPAGVDISGDISGSFQEIMNGSFEMSSMDKKF